MKLVIATGIYPPDIGGPATYSKKIKEEFSNRGWDITVLTYGDNDFPSKDEEIIKISRNHNIFPRYFLYTYNLIKLSRKSDLIYAQGPVGEGLPSLIAAKITGKKYVLKIVGDYAWEAYSRVQEEFIDLDKFQKLKNLPLKIKILKWIEKKVSNNAKEIITPSLYLKKIVKKWGIEEDKINVIYNAQEIEQIKKCEHHFSGDIIFSAGRLVPWKGFDSLIDIMPELLKINSNFRLVIAGDGPEFENLKKKIRLMEFSEDVVKLTGKLDHQTLLQYLEMASLFILNSGYEGLSHLIIEAMNYGKPILVSDIGGNPELIENEKTGLLFQYDNKEEIINAVKKIWQNKNLRDKLAENAKLKIKKFSLEKMIKETLEILEK